MIMIPVKRNSDEFKTIKKLISTYKNKANRLRLILLYVLKPSASLEEAIVLNDQKKNAGILYDLAYDSLEDYFENPAKKLFRDEKNEIYYFKNSAKSKWMEFPFSFNGTLRKKLKEVIPVKLRKVN